MPIRKRFGQFVKRLPDGTVEIRTPADCTNWGNDFRKRIIGDYLAPNVLIDVVTYNNRFKTDTIYHVQGKRVMFRQPTRELANMPKALVVLRTEVIDVTTKRVMLLKHSEPAMRVLMVYSFLVEKRFDGVALFDTYDWHP